MVVESGMAISPALREELIIKIHDELRRIHELLDYLDMVLPEHEEKLKEHPSD